jgi:hypothetical protein
MQVPTHVVTHFHSRGVWGTAMVMARSVETQMQGDWSLHPHVQLPRASKKEGQEQAPRQGCFTRRSLILTASGELPKTSRVFAVQRKWTCSAQDISLKEIEAWHHAQCVLISSTLQKGSISRNETGVAASPAIAVT